VKEGESSSNNVDEPIGRRFDDDKGIWHSTRGRCRGGKFEVVHFKCGIQGHTEFEFP
jgi:hypothetical protein